MVVLTAGKSIKDGFLSGIGEPSNVWADTLPDAADEEYRRDVQYIYEDNLAMLLRKDISKAIFNELMMKCRDKEYVKKVAAGMRESERQFKYWNGLAKKYGITEKDIEEMIEEVKQEERDRNGW